MTIVVIGTGYVGLVTGACLATIGHRVTCVDIDATKVASLTRGRIPIHEPGLTTVVRKAIAAGRLAFTTSYADAVSSAQLIFIGVGTPSLPSGKADLRAVFAATRSLAPHLHAGTVVATKSTVPVGTNAQIRTYLRARTTKAFSIASCPEFLREGSAVKDFFAPDRVVIGADDQRGKRVLLAAFRRVRGPKFVTDIASAELIKYASNAFLATKISFINEIANVSERVGADVDVVAEGMGMDPRIGRQFLKAGIGYGGSCFPKDVRALHQIAGTNGYTFHLLRSVIEVNNRQRTVIQRKLLRHFRSLRGKRIGLLGLAFKAHTDDVRESAAVDIANQLDRAGARVVAYDPIAAVNARRTLRPGVRIAQSPYDALQGTDAVILATEWPEFRRLQWTRVRRLVRHPIVIDGRNVLDRAQLIRLGFTYEGVGR